MTGKVTAGLGESSCSLPPLLYTRQPTAGFTTKSSVGWLSRDRSTLAETLVSSMGLSRLFTLFSSYMLILSPRCIQMQRKTVQICCQDFHTRLQQIICNWKQNVTHDKTVNIWTQRTKVPTLFCSSRVATLLRCWARKWNVSKLCSGSSWSNFLSLSIRRSLFSVRLARSTHSYNSVNIHN